MTLPLPFHRPIGLFDISSAVFPTGRKKKKKSILPTATKCNRLTLEPEKRERFYHYPS